MAVFPKTESEIRALAQTMIIGLAENPNFPALPVSTSDLRNLLDAYIASDDAQTAAYALAEQATDAKKVARKNLTDAMRADLRYAEFAADGDDAQLNAIGWSGRAPHSPVPAPGQPLNMRVVTQSPGTVLLHWERPSEGGAAAYFVIKRLVLGEEAEWLPIHTMIGIEAELSNQERNKETEYCVVAINKSGESLPSNSVMVVL